MTNFSTIFFVALLGLVSILTFASQECPRHSLKATVRPNAKRGILAGKGQAKITVTLKSKGPVGNLEFQLNLPNGLSVVWTTMRPSPKPHTLPQIVENTNGATAIYWQDLAFTERKGGKRRFRVKVKADACAPATLAVNAFAYLVNATDVSCITPLANPAIVGVRYSKRKKDATCAPTPAPSNNPTQPFALFGEGQRFSQGGRLAPFQNRLSMPSTINRHEDFVALHHSGDRHLQSIDSLKACYEYCSLNGDKETPFFFSWSSVTSQCFCCVGVCTPFIFDPDNSVYEALLPWTFPPTSIPTATATPTAPPTPTPTASPTSGPTRTPTQAPSTTPTPLPSSAPTPLPSSAPTPVPSSAPTALSGLCSIPSGSGNGLNVYGCGVNAPATPVASGWIVCGSPLSSDVGLAFQGCIDLCTSTANAAAMMFSMGVVIQANECKCHADINTLGRGPASSRAYSIGVPADPLPPTEGCP